MFYTKSYLIINFYHFSIEENDASSNDVPLIKC